MFTSLTKKILIPITPRTFLPFKIKSNVVHLRGTVHARGDREAEMCVAKRRKLLDLISQHRRRITSRHHLNTITQKSRILFFVLGNYVKFCDMDTTFLTGFVIIAREKFKTIREIIICVCTKRYVRVNSNH